MAAESPASAVWSQRPLSLKATPSVEAQSTEKTVEQKMFAKVKHKSINVCCFFLIKCGNVI